MAETRLTRRAAFAATLKAALTAAFTLLFCAAIMGQETKTKDKTIGEVITIHAAEILAIPGVVGIAEGRCDGTPCIRVFVDRRTEQIARSVPAAIEGYPVVVEETGPFRPVPGPGGG